MIEKSREQHYEGLVEAAKDELEIDRLRGQNVKLIAALEDAIGIIATDKVQVLWQRMGELSHYLKIRANARVAIAEARERE